MFHKFFDKKSTSLADKSTKGSGVNTLTNKSLSQNQQLAEELHKPIIRKFKKRKVHSTFKDNIWGADLADMLNLADTIKELDFYYVLLIFLVNMLGLFP